MAIALPHLDALAGQHALLALTLFVVLALMAHCSCCRSCCVPELDMSVTGIDTHLDLDESLRSGPSLRATASGERLYALL